MSKSQHTATVPTYIQFADKPTSSRTIEILPGRVMADFDENGNLFGVEVVSLLKPQHELREVDGVICPEDYTFGSINVFVHHDDVTFAELQWALLGIATEHEKAVRERDGLRSAISERLQSTEALIARGKGTWPEKNYVRDEDWACWHQVVMTLKSILFSAEHYKPPSVAALPVQRNSTPAESKPE